MHFVKSVAKSIKETVDTANLKLVTKESLDKSDEIKTRVRAKLATLSAEQQKTSEYAGIVATHEQIEKNHDTIYHRPENGVNPDAAEAECKALLVLQQELESTFNLAFAKLTGDEKVVVENSAKQIEETKDAAIATANEVADKANNALRPTM